MSAREFKENSLHSHERQLANQVNVAQERIRDLDKQLATMDALHFPTMVGTLSSRAYVNGRIQCVEEVAGYSQSTSLHNSGASGSHKSRISPHNDGHERRRERHSSKARSRERDRKPSESSRNRDRHYSNKRRERRRSSRDRKRERSDSTRSTRSRSPAKRSRRSGAEYDRMSSESMTSTRTASSTSTRTVSSTSTRTVSSKRDNSSEDSKDEDKSLHVPSEWVLPEAKDTLEDPTPHERLVLERFEIFFREVASILSTRVVCSRTNTNGLVSISVGFEKIPPEFLQGVCATREAFDRDTVDLRCYQLLITRFVQMGILQDDFPSLIYRYQSFGCFIANYLSPLLMQLVSTKSLGIYQSSRGGNLMDACRTFQGYMRHESAAFWEAQKRTTVDSFVTYQKADYKDAVSRVTLDRPHAPFILSPVQGNVTPLPKGNSFITGPVPLMNINVPPPMSPSFGHSLPRFPQKYGAPPLLPPQPITSRVPPPLCSSQPPPMLLRTAVVLPPSIHMLPGPSTCSNGQKGMQPSSDDFSKRTDDFLASLAVRNFEDAQRQKNNRRRSRSPYRKFNNDREERSQYKERERSESPPVRFYACSKSPSSSFDMKQNVPLPKQQSHNGHVLVRNAAESVYSYPPSSAFVMPKKSTRPTESEDDFDLVFS